MAEPLEGEILGMGSLVDVAALERNRARVESSFWPKLRKVAARIPFADEVLAAYYCATDPATPARVRAILMAALAYFILPLDLVPDVLLHLGFTDDATVLATAIGLVSRHIKPVHRRKARAKLDLPED
jgi:uncharacterized membrane protein YkvA (DUF1232 family)